MPLVTFEEHDQLGETVISNPPLNRFTLEAITDLSNAVKAAATSVAEAPAVMLSEDFKNGVDSLKQYGLGHATFHGR
jgi:hypothetical protein